MLEVAVRKYLNVKGEKYYNVNTTMGNIIVTDYPSGITSEQFHTVKDVTQPLVWNVVTTKPCQVVEIPLNVAPNVFGMYDTAAMRTPFGTQWEEVGDGSPPQKGRRLENEYLSRKLKTSRTITQGDLTAFGLPTLRPDHYIESNGKYYQPRYPGSEFSKFVNITASRIAENIVKTYDKRKRVADFFTGGNVERMIQNGIDLAVAYATGGTMNVIVKVQVQIADKDAQILGLGIWFTGIHDSEHCITSTYPKLFEIFNEINQQTVLGYVNCKISQTSTVKTILEVLNKTPTLSAWIDCSQANVCGRPMDVAVEAMEGSFTSCDELFKKIATLSFAKSLYDSTSIITMPKTP